MNIQDIIDWSFEDSDRCKQAKIDPPTNAKFCAYYEGWLDAHREFRNRLRESQSDMKKES